MNKFKAVAAGIAASLAVGYAASASAAISSGAIAQSYLEVNNFQIRRASGASLGAPISGTSILPGVTVTAVNSTAQVTPCLDLACDPGVQTVFTVGGGLNLVKSVGTGYGATSILSAAGTPTQSYAGGTSTSVGNALTASDKVVVNSAVELQFPNLVGNSNSKQTLNSRFTFTVTNDFVFELSFDATGFMRTALGDNFIFAKAARSWNASVSQLLANGTTSNLLSWSPDGTASNTNCAASGQVTRCVEVADGFSLNTNAPTAAPGEDFDLGGVQTGLFQFELGLRTGTYIFDITHLTTADAAIVPNVIPEPGTLALLGAGLMGIAARRRKTA